MDNFPFWSSCTNLLLTIIEPLHEKWMINLRNKLISEKSKKINLSGWKTANILGAPKQSTKKSLR